MPRFQKGHPGGPGKPKGTKDAASLMKMALAALDKVGGQEYLAEQAKAKPAAFLAFISKLLPRDMSLHADVEGLEDLLLRWSKGHSPAKPAQPEPAKPPKESKS